MVTSSKKYDEYESAVAYLRDIDGLPQFYVNILNHDDDTLYSSIPQGLQKAKVVRPLVFGGGMLEPRLNFSRDKWIANLHSLFCFVTGRDQHEYADCDSCKGHKVYPSCIKFDLMNGGSDVARETRRKACANCVYNENATRCSFNAAKKK